LKKSFFFPNEIIFPSGHVSAVNLQNPVNY
jgi:hypothetical protein